MSKELYINGYRILLSDDTHIGVTYQANTLSDLQNRQGIFTPQFTVPKAGNEIALENSSNVNASTTIPYRKNNVKYVEDGIEIIVDGFAIVQAYDGQYKINAYSGNIDPFDLMSSNTLKDIDLSDLDHEYSSINVTNSYTNADSFIYALVGWKKPTGSLTNAQLGLAPFMFIKDMMTRIGSAIGYTISGSLLSDPLYHNGLISTILKHDDAWVESKNSKVTITADFNVNSIISSPPEDVTYNPPFTNSGLIFGNIYTADEPMSVNFRAVVPMKFGHATLPSAFADTCSIEIVNITTATIIASEQISPNTGIGGGAERYYTFLVETGYVTLDTGDQIQVRFAQQYSAIGQYRYTYLAGAEFFATAKNAVVPYLGSQINMSSIQHDMLQKEFVKGIMNVFCVVPQTNLATRTLSLNFLNDIKDNLPNAINWSRRIDTKLGVSITYRDTAFAKKNNIVWDNDDDVVEAIKDWVGNETDGYFLIDDENLDEEKDVIQLPFSGTQASGSIPKRNDDYTYDDFKPRLLFLNRVFYTTLGEYSPLPVTYHGALFQADNAGFIPGTVWGFSFRQNIHPSLTDKRANAKYSTLKEMMTSYKKVTAYFKLNATDIAKLNFLIPIYLDVHTPTQNINGYFYLNKVENYKGGELTKCELIRL